MHDGKENPAGAGQQSDCAHHSTTSEPSLERQAQQRAEERRKAGGNGEIPPDPARLFMSFRTLVSPHLDDPQTLDGLVAELAGIHERSTEELYRWLDDIRKEFASAPEESDEEPISPKGGNGHDYDEPPDWQSQDLPPLSVYGDQPAADDDGRPIIDAIPGQLHIDVGYFWQLPSP